MLTATMNFNGELSRGAIQRIYAEDKTVDGAILQICSIKPIQAAQQGVAGVSSTRYRLTLSDGEFYLPAMLATQLNNIATDNLIDKFSVVKLSKYLCNTVHNKKIIIVLKLDVVQRDVGMPIGKAVSIELQNQPGEQQQPQHAQQPPQQQQQYNNNNNNYQQYNKQPPPQPQQHQQGGGYGAAPMHQQQQQQPRSQPNNYGAGESPAKQITPIERLNPYQNRWTIKARVMSKGAMKTYHNAKGEGHLISIDLVDESGEIRATAFGDAADRIDQNIEQNKVYTFSKGSIKPANMKFTTLKHQYELTFDRNTTFELVEDAEASSVPAMRFDFVRIADIENAAADTTVDVLGVLKDVQNAVPITTKAGKSLTKRDLVIMDESNTEIVVTLWGAQAETIDAALGSILAIKNCRVGDYNGKNLSVQYSSVLMFNPDTPDAHRLRGWYDTIGRTAEVQSLSRGNAAGGGGPTSWNDPHYTIGDLESPTVKDSMRMNNKPVYFITSGYVTMIKRENVIYDACPTCNKKLIQSGTKFSCERCNNQEIDNPSKRMFVQLRIADSDGQCWATAFQEQAEILLGHSAEELAYLKDENEEAFDAKFSAATFKHLQFKLRARLDNYQDQEQLRCNVMGFREVDFAEESRNLLAAIKQLRM